MQLLTITFSVLFSCTAATDWWQHEVFYQIYPRSFQDSDGDGLGDLKGIQQRLPYFKEIGIDAVWISPIMASPMQDFGYDISDYRDIAEIFGSLQDFEELVANAKELGIKVILDFVPNHTSEQHNWFKLSQNRTPGYEDYYIWRDGKVNSDGSKLPPNNWLSNFGGPAWSFNEIRQQWYLHQFGSFQPDLNYWNPKVVQEMKDTLIYWLDKGIGGFRVDAVPFLFEDQSLRDEPLSNDPTAQPSDYAYLQHPFTNNLPETYDMIYQWRELLDDYAAKTDNITRVMMTEAYAEVQKQVLYYGDGHSRNGAHFTFNFQLLSELSNTSNAHDFQFIINKWLSYLPVQYTSNWVISNHDNNRPGTHYGADKIDGLNMLILSLPGVAVTYYGDELGMVNEFISWEDTQDPQGIQAGPDRYLLFSRDGERTPMQWDTSKNAGFSTATSTWLPTNENYKELNVQTELESGASHLNIYKRLVQLRKEDAFRYGELEIKSLDDNVLALTRVYPGSDTYIYVFNLGNTTGSADLSYFGIPSDTAQIVIASVNAAADEGAYLPTSGFQIAPYTAYILRA